MEIYHIKYDTENNTIFPYFYLKIKEINKDYLLAQKFYIRKKVK